MRSPSTELAAGAADVCQKPLMVVAIFAGDAVTDAMAVCSLPVPVLAPPSSPPAAAAGPTWSAVALAASVSTLTERPHLGTARALLCARYVRARISGRTWTCT